MYYRVKFKSVPEEFVFVECGFVLVRDLIQSVRDHFKIYQSDLAVYDEHCIRLYEAEHIQNARTYIVKRIPSNRHYKRKI